ncbi:MAG: Ser-Thr-rich GPI-anchored membrane family protein, partial [Candidatus Eisenbacteria bacterium]|nr:Ser-Thr-rich GPI-anchored membrane family protein [Candidatus Eisenbacteria bacterium]
MAFECDTEREGGYPRIPLNPSSPTRAFVSIVESSSFPIELDAFDETEARLALWRAALPLPAEMAQFEADRTLRSFQYYDAEVPPGGAPNPGLVTVLAPNSGEVWVTGDVQTIAWSKSGESGALVDIELLLNGAVCGTIVTGAENSGAYGWTVARCASGETGYAVRVRDTSSGRFDDSDATFSVVEPVPVTIFADGFETTTVPGSVWSATDGNSLSGLDYWGNEPVTSSGRAHTGSWSAYCNARSNLTNQKYDNYMTADMTLIDPIDLSGYTNVQLSFWLWYKTSNSADYLAFHPGAPDSRSAGCHPRRRLRPCRSWSERVR